MPREKSATHDVGSLDHVLLESLLLGDLSSSTSVLNRASDGRVASDAGAADEGRQAVSRATSSRCHGGDSQESGVEDEGSSVGHEA